MYRLAIAAGVSRFIKTTVWGPPFRSFSSSTLFRNAIRCRRGRRSVYRLTFPCSFFSRTATVRRAQGSRLSPRTVALVWRGKRAGIKHCRVCGQGSMAGQRILPRCTSGGPSIPTNSSLRRSVRLSDEQLAINWNTPRDSRRAHYSNDESAAMLRSRYYGIGKGSRGCSPVTCQTYFEINSKGNAKKLKGLGRPWWLGLVGLFSANERSLFLANGSLAADLATLWPPCQLGGRRTPWNRAVQLVGELSSVSVTNTSNEERFEDYSITWSDWKQPVGVVRLRWTKYVV